jgi:hypothetical protein
VAGGGQVVNDWALSWLRAMKTPTPAPAQGAHDRHREQQTRRLAASLADEVTTPAPLPHAIADQISEARLAPDDQRGAREADLTQQINALREGQA